MAAVKRAMWDTIMNPHLYKVYTKVIDKALHILPSPEFDGHEVIPHLYVGDVWAAYNLDELKKRNITHVVTVVMGLEPTFPADFKYMNVQIRDVESEMICDHFEKVVKFIDEGRAAGNVFLHCLRGVSRSGTIAAAYVIYSNRITAAEAVALLREKRGIINPNPSFLKQLENYYTQITTTHAASASSSQPESTITTTHVEAGDNAAASSSGTGGSKHDEQVPIEPFTIIQETSPSREDSATLVVDKHNS